MLAYNTSAKASQQARVGSHWKANGRQRMIRRSFLYGLAAHGQAGVERALTILGHEIDRTLALIGRPRLADVDRSAIRLRGAYTGD